MKTNRIMRSHRFNKMVLDDLQELLKELNISETSFIEIAVIEKMAKIKSKREADDEIDLEVANRSQIG